MAGTSIDMAIAVTGHSRDHSLRFNTDSQRATIDKHAELYGLNGKKQENDIVASPAEDEITLLINRVHIKLLLQAISSFESEI